MGGYRDEDICTAWELARMKLLYTRAARARTRGEALRAEAMARAVRFKALARAEKRKG